MMTPLGHHFMILGFKISIFCETGYKLSTCQVPNQSVIPESNFTEIFIRQLKNSLCRHYDVNSQYLAFKIVHVVELNRGYQLSKFHWPRFSVSNFMKAGGKHPLPQDLHTL